MDPQHRRVFVRIKHDLLLFSAQLFALRNRRRDMSCTGSSDMP